MIDTLSLYDKNNENLQKQFYDDFCTSLLFSFNIRCVKLLKSEQNVNETGLTVGQVFGVADQIYNFAKTYSPRALKAYLENYILLVTDFVRGYTGSEVLLYQIDHAISDYVDVCHQLQVDVLENAQLFIELFKQLIKWVDFQLYDIYYELLINVFLVLSNDKRCSMS